MTNLYELLQEFRRRVKVGPYNMKSIPVSPDELDWIDQYLASPDIDLHFKARQLENTPTQENVFAKDYAIKGSADDVFALITDAMLQNPNFAATILAAGSYYRDHCLTCDDCLQGVAHTNPMETNWQFLPHKPE